MKLPKRFKTCRMDHELNTADCFEQKARYGKKCLSYHEGYCDLDKKKCKVITYVRETK